MVSWEEGQEEDLKTLHHHDGRWSHSRRRFLQENFMHRFPPKLRASCRLPSTNHMGLDFGLAHWLVVPNELLSGPSRIKKRSESGFPLQVTIFFLMDKWDNYGQLIFVWQGLFRAGEDGVLRQGSQVGSLAKDLWQRSTFNLGPLTVQPFFCKLLFFLNAQSSFIIFYHSTGISQLVSSLTVLGVFMPKVFQVDVGAVIRSKWRRAIWINGPWTLGLYLEQKPLLNADVPKSGKVHLYSS